MTKALSSVLSATMMIGLVACHPRSQGASPGPAKAEAAAPRLVSVRADSGVGSSHAVTLRQARERAYQAAAQIDTIIVHPDTIKVRVGQVVPLFTSVTIDARTA